MKKTFYFFLIHLVTTGIFFSLNANDAVRVNILSNQIQNMKEYSYLEFKISNNGKITNLKTDKTLNLSYFKLVKKDKWTLITDVEEIDFDLNISGDSIKVFNNIEYIGTYPLPLNIGKRNNIPELIVSENIYKYSIDSAIAELGENIDGSQEALLSIAHLVLVRTKLKIKKKSSLFDFSDLSNNQKYKGILISNKISLKLEDYEIDIDKLKGELFFHSESGGKTFSQKLFGFKEEGYEGVEDILINSKISLSNPKEWESKINNFELMDILNFKGSSDNLIKLFNTQKSENLRLKINRVKGWTFIRSNYYKVELIDDIFIFKGKGHGHNVGLSINGALKLSQLGFSKFEIIDHYFPGIEWKSKTNISFPENLFFIILSEDGKVIKTSYDGILKRKIPPGSFLKLFSTMVFLNIDPNIKNLTLNCQRSYEKNNICWNKKGHGIINLKTAISQSCNYYFSKMADKIPYLKFKEELNIIINKINIKNYLREGINYKSYKKILPGLDFKIRVSMRDLISLINYFNNNQATGDENREKEFIRNSLKETFKSGTASIKKTYAERENFWGKTSTVAFGTNKIHSYGFFLGGNSDKNIIVILKNATGREAALFSEQILKSFEYEN